MTVRKYSSRSQQTTLSSPITSTATSMTVVNGASIMGGKTLSGAQTYTVVIDPDTALEEIVDVTVYSSGNTLTITRGIDGPTPGTGYAHSAGAVVRHMAIGRDYQEANDHIEDTTNVHGITDTAALVTLAGTQTLTNKTLTSPKINENVAVTATATELNILDGVTASTAELNLLDGVTATTTELNYVDGVTSAIQTQLDAKQAVVSGVSSTEIGYLDGVTSAIQTQIDGKQAVVSGVSSTEIGYLDGVTSAIQTQIDTKAPTASPTFTGTVTLPTGTVTSAMIANGTIVDADVSGTAAIAYSKLSLGGTITSADLVDGTIVNADINASAGIALSKLAVDPLARANHTGTQVASTISDFDTQVRTSKVTDLAAPTGSFSMNSQKITNLGLATSSNDAVNIAYIESQKGIANGLANLDGSGKIPLDHIPASAIADTFVVNSQSAMLALSAGVGDIAVRTDLNKSFILQATPATTLSNWIELLTPTDSVLSVDGITGAVDLTGVYLNKTTGVLAGDLDANSIYTVKNLKTPVNAKDAAPKDYVDAVAGSATAAAASAAAAATTYDNFDDRYLGSKSTAPTVDNDGNAILEGAIYWNSVTNAMYAWTGTEWGSISSTADIYRFRFTADGGETSISGTDDNGLTLAYIPGKEQVYLNGVLLARTSDYSATDGSSITSLSALAASDILEVITFTAFELADSIARSLFDAKGDILVATSADTPGKLALGTNGYYLQADSSEATGLKWAAVSGYSAPTLGSTTIASGATVTTISGLTDIVLNGPGSVADELTLILMGAL